MVAIFLTAIGVTALVGVLGTVSRTDARVMLKERVERAADEKLSELVATGEIQYDGSGSFDNPEDADLSWSSQFVATGTEGLSHASVTVSAGDYSAVADRLIFIAPESEETEGTEGTGAAAQ